VKNFFPHARAHALAARSPSSLWRCSWKSTTTRTRILETYLNEIYLGPGPRPRHPRRGLASLYYFGKTVDHLTLAESALLVGMVKGPAFYDPFRNPERALERRNSSCARQRTAASPPGGVLEGARRASASTEGRDGTSPTRPSRPSPAAEATITNEAAALGRLRVFTTLARACRPRRSGRSSARSPSSTRKDLRQPGLEGAVVVTDTVGEVQRVWAGASALPRFTAAGRRAPVGSPSNPRFTYRRSRIPRTTLVTPIDDGPSCEEPRRARRRRRLRQDLLARLPLRPPRPVLQRCDALSDRYRRRESPRHHQTVGIGARNAAYAYPVGRWISPARSGADVQTIASGGFRTPCAPSASHGPGTASLQALGAWVRGVRAGAHVPYHRCM